MTTEAEPVPPSGLQIRHQSREDFIALLDYLSEQVGVKRVFFAQKRPQQSGPVSLSPEARFDFPLTGVKRIHFASGNAVRDLLLSPGDAHYCPPLCWKWPRWDHAHEMSSLVCNPAYIRVTYIDFRPPDDYYETHGARSYYHTAHPPGPAVTAVFHALNALAEQGRDTGAPELVRALLHICRDELHRDTPAADGKARSTWRQLHQYLQENFHAPINREHVARHFGLAPSHVSRLFAAECGANFNAVLRRIRLEHAALLLKNTRMNIDEITDRCGYLSSTFFIAAFKRAYGITPGRYRQQS